MLLRYCSSTCGAIKASPFPNKFIPFTKNNSESTTEINSQGDKIRKNNLKQKGLEVWLKW
jgi:hypothetical protein